MSKGWANVRADDHDRHVWAGMGIKSKGISNRRMNLYKAQKDIAYNFQTKPKRTRFQNSIVHLGQNIKFNLWNEHNEGRSELPEYEVERIYKLINEGYTSGDIVAREDGEELSGWWSI